MAIMFIIRWYYALITFIIVLILYKIVDFLKPGKLLSYDAVSLWCEIDIQFKIKKRARERWGRGTEGGREGKGERKGFIYISHYPQTSTGAPALRRSCTATQCVTC